MKIDAIIEKILSDAKREAAQAQGEATERVEQILRAANEAAGRERGAADVRAREEAALARERMLRMAAIEQKKEQLNVRRGVLDRAFEGALSMLRDMPDKERSDFYQSLILSEARGGETAAASPSIYKIFTDAAVRAMEAAGVSLICDENMPGGALILKKGDMQINMALEAVVDALRPSLEPMVDAALFKEEG